MASFASIHPSSFRSYWASAANPFGSSKTVRYVSKELSESGPTLFYNAVRELKVAGRTANESEVSPIHS